MRKPESYIAVKLPVGAEICDIAIMASALGKCDMSELEFSDKPRKLNVDFMSF